MGKVANFFNNIFFFQKPQAPQEQFILKEYKEGADKKSNQQSSQQSEQQPPSDKSGNKIQPKKNVKTEKQDKKSEPKSKENPAETNKVSPNLDKNLDFLKDKYSIPLSTDVMLREFDISLENKAYKAFIIFIDGMTDRKVISDDILQPLMLLTSLEKSSNVDDIIVYLERNVVTQNQLLKSDDFGKILDQINFGCCVLFVESARQALILDVKSWEHRAVTRPTTEITIRGPQEGFGETPRANTALIRKILKNENLIVESLNIGQRSNTPCSIIYLKDLANPNLVNEVRRRLSSLKLDFANDSGIVEQLIEDNTFLPAPQTIASERPDRVASMLCEGKVAILVDGNPFVLVVPTTFFALMHSPEDMYVRFPYANLMRMVRYLGAFAALLLPGLYVAITTYHQEMIPTDLLLAIVAAREKVPFPTVVEMLIMEIAFELIREAGIRMPGTIGPTLGIIGALILGQAAVAASVVSPILIIIVAVTGIGSLAIPNFSLAFAFRMLRFGYILLGSIAGLLGITLGLFVQGLFLATQKSFGVPFLSPFAPAASSPGSDVLSRSPMWMQDKRPDYINPLDTTRQPKISRGWIKGKKKEDKQ